MRGVNILVTGGCGFIGGHLVEKLLLEGARVTIVDIFLDPRSIFAQNNLRKRTNLELVDIRNRKKIFTVFKKCKPSYVIHLAAKSLIGKAYLDPYECFDINIMGSVNILDAVRMLYNVRGVIVASSDKAYGKSTKAYKENTPLKGDHPYDVSKSSADLIAQTYYKTYNTPVVITRFGNIYGQGDLHFDRIIPGICKAVIKNEVLKIRSDGSYIRDYIYIKDAIDGYMHILKNIDRIHGEAFNLSSPDTMSVLEVIKKVEKSLNLKVKYKIVNNFINEIPYQHLDDTKIRKLGYDNKFSIELTMPQTLSWYKRIL